MFVMLVIRLMFFGPQGLKAKMGEHLPDKGANLARWEKQIVDRITSIKGGELTMMEYNKNKDNVDVRIVIIFRKYTRNIYFQKIN